MIKTRNVTSTETEYARVYECLRGMSLRGDSESYLYTENMYVDHHSGDEAVESIPGFRRLYSFSKRINGIFHHRVGEEQEHLIIHAADELYRFPLESYKELENLKPIATLRDAKSRAFTVGSRMYILDGGSITVIEDDGSVTYVDEEDTSLCYVPITYKNGLPYEERNLLSDRFRETTHVESSSEMSFGTPELVYAVTDSLKRRCAVVGLREREAGPVYIPSHTVIGGREYTVSEIAPSALRDCTYITELYTAVGLEKIGKYALWGATSLTRVMISPTVMTIEPYAFRGCEALEFMLLGSNVTSLGENFLALCSSLTEVKYAGSEEELELIGGRQYLDERTVVCGYDERGVTVSIPVCSPAATVYRVTVNGSNAPFSFYHSTSEVVLSFADRNMIDGGEVTVYGTLKEGDTRGFLATEMAANVSAAEAILGCRLCEMYDNRVFLSGNPELNGVVFHSTLPASCPSAMLYFGNESYLVDGVGDYAVSSLLTTDGALAVYKRCDDGSGSIFYHTPKGEGQERSYPASYIHGKVEVLSEAYRFLNDGVFITPYGLSRLKYVSSGYRELGCLSDGIWPLLARENASKIHFTEWMGYLVLLSDGNMYLADPTERGRGGDYRWYYITGVGTYSSDSTVYRYCSVVRDGYDTPERPDDIVDETVYSTISEGETIYYVSEGERKYAVTPTEQKRGGIFSPAEIALGVGERLFFGTSAGVLCIFNNDMRGVPPERIAYGDDFDGEAYEREMGERIHPDFYTFDSHAPRYAVLTAHDDCEVPYLEKRTVPDSLVLKLKNLHTGGLCCEVGTDNEGFVSYGTAAASAPCFADMSFSALTGEISERLSLSVEDRSQGWTEKQVAVYTDHFRSPFGIYGISFRYKLKGKIKKTT